MSTIALNRPALNCLNLRSEADLLSAEDLAQILQLFFSLMQQKNSQGTAQRREIEQALKSPGRTIFLHGGRAAGNTFAQTLAAHRASCSGRNEKTAFVIDEFDEIEDEAQRARFAGFINQIGDRNLPIRFVLCGVSESLKKLLRAHESCYDGIDFTRLESRDNESRDNYERREAPMRSHGQDSPHHVYLLSERLFWEMFNDPTFARSLI